MQLPRSANVAGSDRGAPIAQPWARSKMADPTAKYLSWLTYVIACLMSVKENESYCALIFSPGVRRYPEAFLPRRIATLVAPHRAVVLSSKSRMHCAPRGKLASLKNCEASALQNEKGSFWHLHLQQTLSYFGTRTSLDARTRISLGTSLGFQMVHVISLPSRLTNRIARAALLRNLFCVERTPLTISRT